jgi:hypothetical protein
MHAKLPADITATLDALDAIADETSLDDALELWGVIASKLNRLESAAKKLDLSARAIQIGQAVERSAVLRHRKADPLRVALLSTLAVLIASKPSVEYAWDPSKGSAKSKAPARRVAKGGNRSNQIAAKPKPKRDRRGRVPRLGYDPGAPIDPLAAAGLIRAGD